jgi:putative hemolysin
MIPLGLVVLACIALWLGAIGAAFSALMRLSLRLLAERQAREGILGRYLDDPVRLFLPVRALLALVHILATFAFIRLIGLEGPHHLGVVLASALGFAWVTEHLLPLVIVRRNPEKVLDRLLPWFDPIARVVWPALCVLAGARRSLEDAPAPGTADRDAGEATDAYLDAGEQQGLIERDERKLLQSVVDFSDTLVREVMTPRPDIVAIRADATLDDLRVLIRDQGYSRMPVFVESLDNISGFVFAKDLMRLPAGQTGGTALSGLMTTRSTPLVRVAHVVPETKKVTELLREFQRGRIQIAIVVDEYGGTAGLVTIEDLIEELVGEIRDEDDEEVDAVVDEPGGAHLVSGKADIRLVASHLGVDIEREGFETFGGYLLARLGRVPAAGESLEIDGLLVDVLDAERRRIHRARVRRPAVAPSAPRAEKAAETGSGSA